MSRYIDADKFLEGISKIHVAHKLSESEEMYFTESEIEALVECEPTVDADVVEVKHGKWINLTPPEFVAETIKSNKNYYFMCSECKGSARFITQEIVYRYCPNCGARMDGAK